MRHHLGALHTIPFGEIQVMTNYSRDWVIMKLKYRVPYDTDVDKVRKIVKKINSENNTTVFLVEQNANLALKTAHRGYVMENGRIIMADAADKLMVNEDVRKAYLGI